MTDVPTPDVTVVAGDPTPAELAAVTAVIAAMAEESDTAPRGAGRGRSAWMRSQRPIRVPINPGAWRGLA